MGIYCRSHIQYGWRRYCLVMVTLIVLCGYAMAQTKAPNKETPLYKMYERAYLMRHTEKGLLIADTLLRKARETGDTHAEIRALSIPYLYAFSHAKTLAEFDKPFRRYQAAAEKYQAWNSYYVAANNRFFFMLNKKRYDEAMSYLESLRAFATKHGHKEGILCSKELMGHYYHLKGENTKSISILRDAIDYAKKNLKGRDHVNLYFRLAYVYQWQGNFAEELRVCDDGLAQSHNPLGTLTLRYCRGVALFMLHRDKDFLDNHRHIIGMREGKGGRVRRDQEFEDAMYIFLSDQQQRAIDRMRSPKMKNYHGTYDVLADMYGRQGDWRNMAEAQDSLLSKKGRRFRDDINRRMLELDKKYDNQRLKAEQHSIALHNTQLDLENNKLALENADLELARAQSAQKLNDLDAANLQLKYANQQLVAQKLRDSVNIGKSMEANYQTENQREQMFLVVLCLLVLIVSAVLYGCYAYRSRMVRRLHDAYDKLEGIHLELESTNRMLHRSHDEQVEARNKAEMADRAKTLFIQDMSHEVRTPLNAVVGFSELLSEQKGELTLQERIDMSRRIKENSQLLLTLINDILDMTNIESGRYQMKTQPTHPNELCRMALSMINQRMTSSVRLAFHTNIADDFTIVSDGDRIHQVLVNLLSNAAKNTERGSITLDCILDPSTSMLTFCVTDTGVGIPKDKISTIFERFSKLDTFKQGVGLGLSISRIIAERLHGTLTVDANYQGGARLVFAIPTSQPTEKGGQA